MEALKKESVKLTAVTRSGREYQVTATITITRDASLFKMGLFPINTNVDCVIDFDGIKQECKFDVVDGKNVVKVENCAIHPLKGGASIVLRDYQKYLDLLSEVRNSPEYKNEGNIMDEMKEIEKEFESGRC